MELMRDGQDTFGKELPSVFEFGHGVRRESRAALSFGEYMGISKAAQHQGLVSEAFVLRSLIDIKMGHLNLHILERPAAELGSVDCCHCHLALASSFRSSNVSCIPASGPLSILTNPWLASIQPSGPRFRDLKASPSSLLPPSSLLGSWPHLLSCDIISL